MHAYNELYVNDAMTNLGEMMDFAVYDCGYDANLFFKEFAMSYIGKAFGAGHPRYVCGRSGVELARELIHELTGEWIETMPSQTIDRSKEYWAGWILGYYQWHCGEDFLYLYNHGLTMERVVDMYILHESDVSAFVERADIIIQSEVDSPSDRLRRLRKYWDLTQRKLAEESGVSLRMIQLYEQGQNDLAKAQADVVCALAKTLHCKAEDLVC